MTFSNALFDQSLAYSAQDLRQLEEHAINGAGIIELGALTVAAGTGFNSNVAAGRAAVRNTVQTQGGLYVVRNNAPVAALHNTPDATNPRIDQIFVKVSDNTDGGDSSDAVAPVIVAGTPTGGATLDNRTGVNAVPTNSLLLYDVLVPSGVGSAASFTYRDRRSYAVRGMIPAARGTTPAIDQAIFTCDPPIVALPSSVTTSQNNFQVAMLVYLPRRIVGATKLRFAYQQASTAALTGSYNIGIYDASMRFIVATGAQAFAGVAGSVNAFVSTITATTLEAGLYYVAMGLASLAGGTGNALTYLGFSTGIIPAGLSGVSIGYGAGVPNASVGAGSGGTTLPTTLLGLTDQQNPAVLMAGPPVFGLATV